MATDRNFVRFRQATANMNPHFLSHSISTHIHTHVYIHTHKLNNSKLTIISHSFPFTSPHLHLHHLLLLLHSSLFFIPLSSFPFFCSAENIEQWKSASSFLRSLLFTFHSFHNFCCPLVEKNIDFCHCDSKNSILGVDKTNFFSTFL